jgi:flagellin
MSISLNTNTSALSAVYNLGVSGKNLQRSLDRLSSGSRINNAIDDAGGLAVSLKLSATLRRTDATIANVNNALSFLQTQDGALAVADKLLNRMSELTALAMDITKSPSDLGLYQTELEGLQGQLYGMLDEEFNGIKLFNPGANAGLSIGNNTPDTTTTLTIVVSSNGDQSIGITQSDLEAISFTVGTSSAQALRMDIDDRSNILTSLAYVKFAINSLAELRARNGAQQAQLNASLGLLEENKVNTLVANGRIMDVDVAAESSAFASNQIRHQASTAMLAQANQGHNVLLRLLS